MKLNSKKKITKWSLRNPNAIPDKPDTAPKIEVTKAGEFSGKWIAVWWLYKKNLH